MKEIVVWDWPVRCFHWLTVILFTGLILTGKAEEDYLQWHFYMGYALSALLIARILYGFIGSKYARFSYFVVGPKHLYAYAKSLLQGKHKRYLSHNPLGAVMVVVLIVVLCVQWLSGLVSTDDIFWFGPLYDRLSEETQVSLAVWHYRLPDILLGLIAVHILAVLFHEIALKERLVRAMFTGKKELNSDAEENENITTPRLGVVISLVISLAWLAWLYSLPI